MNAVLWIACTVTERSEILACERNGGWSRPESTGRGRGNMRVAILPGKGLAGGPATRVGNYRDSHVGRLDRALDQAESDGGTIADMKRDWKVVYPN